jgi:hypothetical protein
VTAHVVAVGECELLYWNERGRKVDFIIKVRSRVIAIEVKSGRAPSAHPGSAAFAQSFKTHRTLLVGGDGIQVEEFLRQPAPVWAT